MKRLHLLSALIIALSFTSTAYAKSVPIEKDAIISDSLKGNPKLINTLALMVRANGYSCKSISGVQPFVFDRGFSITCNNFTYTYKVKDRGGNWSVEVD